jgi:hypothetical protein
MIHLIFRKNCIDDGVHHMDKLSKKTSPSFKEVASLINATHMIVEEIDSKIINNMAPDFFLRALKFILKNDEQLIQKYLRFNKDQKQRLILNIFQNKLAIPPEDVTIYDELFIITKAQINCA